MGLSSNSLIHFTKNLNSLNGILKDNFKIRYCRETIYTSKDHRDILVPIVSFCDIPFSQIMAHVNSYGCYGIGLSKSWAEKNGLNPVFYVEKNSSFAASFFNHLFEKITGSKDKFSDLSLEEKYILDVIRYMKNYQGNLNRFEKKTIENYRFSDEREWRFVLNPENKELLIGNLKSLKTQAEIKEAKESLNDKIKDERLYFEPDDINYIIIKKESERNSVIRNLEQVKGKYPMEQVKRLTSRILSVEQIKTDF